MSSVRLFLAIPIPAPIRQAILRHVTRLQEITGQNVRWVAEENIHLTLKFFGATDSQRLPTLQESLADECAHHAAFEFSVGGFGVFPSQHRPHVLWVGVQAPPQLATLQQNLEQALTRSGFPAERQPFSPHITLGRVREPIGSISLNTLRVGLQAIHIGGLGAAPVNFIHLYRSDLQPGGPSYTLLFKAPLGE